MSWFSRVKAKLTGKPETMAATREATSARAGDAAGDEPIHVWEMQERAAQLEMRGDHGAALAMRDRVIAREPSALAFYQRGLLHCQLKHYPEAIADLDRSLEMHPRFAAALTERGLAYDESGDPERALRDYDAAIVADPSYVIAYENRAMVYLSTKRWADVVTSLDIGLRMDPQRPAMRYRRGIGHEMLGNLANACADVTGWEHKFLNRLGRPPFGRGT